MRLLLFFIDERTRKMADKRMFSLKIVDSDLFLEMPLSSQCLYFHLSIRADDDGFVINFERGIIVITHWKINNYIRSDRRKDTIYIEEKSSLVETQNGAYTRLSSIGIPSGNQLSTNCQTSIDKNRLDKVSIDKGRGEAGNQKTTQTPYGEYKNIFLTDEEYRKLKEQLKEHAQAMINKLSRYIKSTGKIYQNHYVTILNWYEQDEEKLRKKRNYMWTTSDYERGDSL